MNKESLLVIGGSGFLGKNLIQAAHKHYDITCISHSSNNIESSLLSQPVVTLDCSNHQHLSDAILDRDFEYVVNFCGYVNHSSLLSGGRDVIIQHFNSTLNLVSCISRRKLKRFVQIGSSDEYGGDAKPPQSESLRESPCTPYSLSKTASTHLLQMLHRSEGFPAVIIRPFLIYGPGQSTSRLIPYAIENCLNKRTFSISTGTQLRDFCFISDFTSAILSTFKAPKVLGEVINIGSGKPVTVRHVVDSIAHKIGSGSPTYGELSMRKSESHSLYPSILKATQLLEWRPIVSLDSGLDQTIKSFRQRP